ncbi:arylamine N-acetyltransferase family protein [Vibrio maerlii]|uniref:arylamine N-acetyltransferase family protein n=1 Tax=Vibrio maerlii TaxID=2231648 RepID=UPI000E3CB31E|nr:arylamine N-acetyltransferase [Vibrio maerlii]
MNTQMLKAYLDKIGFCDEMQPQLETLTALHNKQHQTIPFENLDIVNGQKIELSEEAIFDKLINQQRGGYCFEVNGLLNQALKATGFDVTQRLGRVHLSATPSGRGHLVNIVRLDNQDWLVDAGFGANTPRRPIPLVFNEELRTDTQAFRFIQDANFGAMLQALVEDSWTSLYSLDMGHVCDGDIEYGNHFASTGDTSLFTSNIVAVSRTEYGPNILFNNRLKLATKDGNTELELTTENEFTQVLNTHFGIIHNVPFHHFQRILNNLD